MTNTELCDEEYKKLIVIANIPKHKIILNITDLEKKVGMIGLHFTEIYELMYFWYIICSKLQTSDEIIISATEAHKAKAQAIIDMLKPFGVIEDEDERRKGQVKNLKTGTFVEANLFFLEREGRFRR